MAHHLETYWTGMTVENARIFIKRSAYDPSLRDQLNEAVTLDAIDACLAANGLSFTDGEFNETYSNLLANSQSAGEAELIREIKTWWDLLLAATPP